MTYDNFKEIVGKNGLTVIGKEGDWILTLKVPKSDWEEADTILGFVSESFGFGNNRLYKNKFIKGTIQFNEPYDDVAISNDFMKTVKCNKITEVMKWFSEHRNEGYAFQVGDTDNYAFIKDITMILTIIFAPEKVSEDVFRDFMNKVRG